MVADLHPIHSIGVNYADILTRSNADDATASGVYVTINLRILGGAALLTPYILQLPAGGDRASGVRVSLWTHQADRRQYFRRYHEARYSKPLDLDAMDSGEWRPTV